MGGWGVSDCCIDASGEIQVLVLCQEFCQAGSVRECTASTFVRGCKRCEKRSGQNKTEPLTVAFFEETGKNRENQVFVVLAFRLAEAQPNGTLSLPGVYATQQGETL